MRPGESSKTAVFVCVGRALAHGTAGVGAFSDPTALELLPDAERAWVERARAHQLPQSGRERWVRLPLADAEQLRRLPRLLPKPGELLVVESRQEFQLPGGGLA